MPSAAISEVPQSLFDISRGWFVRQRRTLMLCFLVLMFVVAALAPRIFITIPAGHGGILWLRFFGGTQTEQRALGEGLHIIFPWDQIYLYDMRVQEHDQSYEVIVREGLQISVRSSFRWHLNHATLPKLHKEIGPNYINVLLVPAVGSFLRERISQYSTEDLFSGRRTDIQREILRSVVSERYGEAVNRIGHASTANEGEDFVTLTDVLLKDVMLPFRVRSAIERKLEQAQISQEYGFRIERERLESERKKIEAQGIQAFQQTVQAGISDAYLKWRGIEATLQLATSQNAKVVIVGGGSQGLPLILNTGDGDMNRAPLPQAPAADPARMQKADADNAGKLSGSIDMSPPSETSPLERLVQPETRDREADAPRSFVPRPAASSGFNDLTTGDEPPYILRSFADAFGYRLQPMAPATSEVIAPAQQPR